MILIVSQLFFYFFFIHSLSYAADTLVLSQFLSGNQTLVSRAGNFEMGFFRPGKSPNYYIGIWFNKIKITQETIVWVANRDTPVSNKFFSRLEIIDGNLVLLNESNNQVWSTNMISTARNSASVILLDDGNLVLRYGSSSSPPIWQSFDHPTHVFLPGSKFGYDKRTNTKQVFTSWRSPEDPAVGLFSLEVDQYEKQYVVKWNRSVQYWASGSWNGRIFPSIPEMMPILSFNFSYIDNTNESYFIYSLDPSVISILIVDVSGQIQQQLWDGNSERWSLIWAQPNQACQVYAYCGAFSVCREEFLPHCSCLIAFKPTSQNEFSGGCVRETELNCRVKEETGFIVSYVPVKFISSFLENRSLSLNEPSCRRSCLDDCSCDAYSFISETCRLWYDEDLNNISLVFVSDNTIEEIFELNIKVASKVVSSRKKNNKVPVGTVAGSVAVVGFVLGLVILIIYRKEGVYQKTTMEGSLVAFVYTDLKAATKNFSDKLGGGGFGSVFKGVLRDHSTIVAVKKLESISQGEKQFRSEVSTIGIIQHIHLVRLHGFCAQGNDKFLVYDFMPNGSLDFHLFHEKQVLNWKTRYEIALGIAKGLVYLHEKCRDCIIHCDIKPENILLDADFCPKIADFGLAKLVGRDFSRVLTTMRGTRGYLAPEWLSGVAVTAKADVFSYGMMLFELVNGKRNSEQSDGSRSSIFFPSLVTNVLMERGDILSLLDVKLNKEGSVEEITKICKVACWCIQDEEDNRPSMNLVEQILEGLLDVNMPPVPRSIKLFVDNTENIVFFTESFSNETSQVQRSSSSGDSQSKSASS